MGSSELVRDPPRTQLCTLGTLHPALSRPGSAPPRAPPQRRPFPGHPPHRSHVRPAPPRDNGRGVGGRGRTQRGGRAPGPAPSSGGSSSSSSARIPGGRADGAISGSWRAWPGRAGPYWTGTGTGTETGSGTETGQDWDPTRPGPGGPRGGVQAAGVEPRCGLSPRCGRRRRSGRRRRRRRVDRRGLLSGRGGTWGGARAELWPPTGSHRVPPGPALPGGGGGKGAPGEGQPWGPHAGTGDVGRRVRPRLKTSDWNHSPELRSDAAIPKGPAALGLGSRAKALSPLRGNPRALDPET